MPSTVTGESNCYHPAAIVANVTARERLIEVAAGLLATGGPEAVTTRSVALAAGVQAPTIYRLFGDKSGLLDAVVAHGLAAYVDGKRIDPDADPVQGLRAGWDLHVGFGLANPALFRLMHTAVKTPDGRAAVEAGLRVLRERVHRVAAAGRLRLAEDRATALIGAAGTGVVFTLLDQPPGERDAGLADAAWDAVCAVILVDRPVAAAGPAAAAVTLRAALADLPGFSAGERELLGEWLARVSG
jgi:AcrR family transcriptional regulator